MTHLLNQNLVFPQLLSQPEQQLNYASWLSQWLWVIMFTWKESMQTGLEASSSSTACSFSMKVLSLVCLGFGGGGGPMGTTSALMCLMAGVVTFSAWLKEASTLKNKRERGRKKKQGKRDIFHLLVVFLLPSRQKYIKTKVLSSY